MAKSKARPKIGPSRTGPKQKATAREIAPVPRVVQFPVAAIGASAGGLAAFTALLKALPAASGMAFVLIQHLDPTHQSALTALLSKASRMPVFEVSDGIALEPDCVYVIPPNKKMTIRYGALRLAPCANGSSSQRPIDEFCIALAANGNSVEGVPVVLFDVDVIQRSVDQAEEARRVATEEHQRSLAVLNSLVAHVAVLGPDGTILETNDGWDEFAKENGGLHFTAIGAGANCLEVCRHAAAQGVSDAQAALDGIRGVLERRQPRFQLEYPYHSATQQRWFLMTVSPLKREPSEGRASNAGAVVSHLNITGGKLAEVAAQRDGATIRALLDSATQSVVAVDTSEKIVLVNGNTEKMFGYKRDELIGQPLEILVPEAFRGRHSDHYKVYFANMGTRTMGKGLTLEGRRKDGTGFPVEIGLSAIETASGKLAVAFVADITERRQLEQAAQKHAQEIQTLAGSLLRAQEEERRRVSLELHDHICQQLASLAIDVGELVASPEPARNTKSRLKALQARIVKASEETRHIAYQLHPSVLDDLGLVASLRGLCDEFTERSKNISLEFTPAALPANVPREVASCLYRVAQEGLQNISKHAGAKRVKVALTFADGALTLAVEDDGRGFDYAATRGRGLGWVGMEERTRLVNGKLTVNAEPGHGTKIALLVPLAAGV